MAEREWGKDEWLSPVKYWLVFPSLKIGTQHFTSLDPGFSLLKMRKITSALPSLPQEYELVPQHVLEAKEAPEPQGSFQTLLKLPYKNSVQLTMQVSVALLFPGRWLPSTARPWGSYYRKAIRTQPREASVESNCWRGVNPPLPSLHPAHTLIHPALRGKLSWVLKYSRAIWKAMRGRED